MSDRPTPVDDRAFKTALAQLASGVTVVIGREPGGRRCGLTVSSFCSVSLEPPLVLACVDSRTDTRAAIQSSGMFGVSVLSESQQDVSQRFAHAGRAKFDRFSLDEGPHGCPLVPGALARLECRVTGAHEAGDHVIFVGEVVFVQVEPGAPLVYQRGGYRKLQP